MSSMYVMQEKVAHRKNMKNQKKTFDHNITILSQKHLRLYFLFCCFGKSLFPKNRLCRTTFSKSDFVQMFSG
jgi:hypothetical protein